MKKSDWSYPSTDQFSINYFTVGCVWQFNTCVQKRYRQCDETLCYHCFDECCKYMMGTTNAMMENSVDEIPVPYMSVEQTTKSSMVSSNTMSINRMNSPTLGT